MKLQPNQVEELLLKTFEGVNVNEFYQLFFDIMMKLERKSFLADENSRSNKANGFRVVKGFGHGKSLELRIPRDRLGNFLPKILLYMREHNEEMQNLAYQLYLKGLTTRDVSSILSSFYGKDYSKSSISRMNQEFVEIVNAWRNRKLHKHYPALIIDALHSKVRRDASVETEATYTVMGLRNDMSRDILAIDHVPIESASGWEMVLRNLKERGLESTALIIADGLTGLENAVAKVFPDAKFQKCVVHLKRNILNKVRAKHKKEISDDLRQVFDVENSDYNSDKATENCQNFKQKWGKIYPRIKNIFSSVTLSYYFTYLEFDYKIRNMIYTSNWVENLNKQFRKVLKNRNSMPSEESLLLLVVGIVMDKSENYKRYKISRFKFDKKLFPNI